NGSGACVYPTVGCRAQSCAAGVLTASANCNGAGSCPAASTSACPSNLACASASACKSTCAVDGDCVSTAYYCNTGSGACVAKVAAGGSCGASNRCASGSCLGGSCCPAACHSFATRRSSDLNGSGACVYPTVGCRAQSCAAGVLTASANCNGAGSC